MPWEGTFAGKVQGDLAGLLTQKTSIFGKEKVVKRWLHLNISKTFKGTTKSLHVRNLNNLTFVISKYSLLFQLTENLGFSFNFINFKFYVLVKYSRNCFCVSCGHFILLFATENPRIMNASTFCSYRVSAGTL